MDSKHTHLLFFAGYTQYSVSGLLIFWVSNTLCPWFRIDMINLIPPIVDDKSQKLQNFTLCISNGLLWRLSPFLFDFLLWNLLTFTRRKSLICFLNCFNLHNFALFNIVFYFCWTWRCWWIESQNFEGTLDLKGLCKDEIMNMKSMSKIRLWVQEGK